MPRGLRPNGKQIFALRSSRGWTVQDLAKESTVSVRTIKDCEKAEKNVDAKTLFKIAKALGVKCEKLWDSLVLEEHMYVVIDRSLLKHPIIAAMVEALEKVIRHMESDPERLPTEEHRGIFPIDVHEGSIIIEVLINRNDSLLLWQYLQTIPRTEETLRNITPIVAISFGEDVLGEMLSVYPASLDEKGKVQIDTLASWESYGLPQCDEKLFNEVALSSLDLMGRATQLPLSKEFLRYYFEETGVEVASDT